MKNTIFGLAAVVFLSAGFTGLVRADDDARIIGRMDHTGPRDALRTVSIYLTFNGDKADGLPSLPSGNETRFYAKVWDDLFLQATTEAGENGVAGYMLTFSSDEEDQKSLSPLEPKDKATLREITAADFRTKDNFEPLPLKAGPGHSKDRGALRLVSYEGFDVEILVLEFKIGDAKLGKKPFLKNLSCLVTVREKPKGKVKK